MIKPSTSRQEMQKSGAYLGSGVVVLPRKSSTRTRLHELAHKKLGHEPGRMPASAFVDKELEAEAYAYRMMGKPLSYKVGIPILYELINYWNFSRKAAYNLVVGRLENMGIRITNTDRRKLSEFAYKEVV